LLWFVTDLSRYLLVAGPFAMIIPSVTPMTTVTNYLFALIPYQADSLSWSIYRTPQGLH